jgi:hypothetical protein
MEKLIEIYASKINFKAPYSLKDEKLMLGVVKDLNQHVAPLKMLNFRIVRIGTIESLYSKKQIKAIKLNEFENT